MMIYVINAHNKMFFVLHDNKKNFVDVWMDMFLLFKYLRAYYNIIHSLLNYCYGCGDTAEIYNLISFIDGSQSFSYIFHYQN